MFIAQLQCAFLLQQQQGATAAVPSPSDIVLACHSCSMVLASVSQLQHGSFQLFCSCATAAACSLGCSSACVPQLQHALLQLFICLCVAAAAYFDGSPLSWTWWGMQKVYQVAYEKVQ